MNAHDIKAEQRRLKILQLLESDPDYTIDSELLAQLLAQIGFGVSSVTLHTDLEMLQEAELLNINDIAGVNLAALRSRGAEVAKGLVSAHGVARPRPQ